MGLLMSTPKLPSMPKKGAKPAAKPKAARKPRSKRSRRPRGKKGGARKRKSAYEEDGEGYEEDGEGYEEDGEGYEEEDYEEEDYEEDEYEEDMEPYASWSPSVNPGKYNALKIKTKGKAEKYESRHQPYEAAEFASAATPMNFTLLLMVLLFIMLVVARS
jgi:hypothetical protein